MNLKISFKNLETLPSLHDKIEKKAKHLKKYFHGDMNINWVCSKDNGMQKSEVHVNVGHHDFYAHAQEKNLYKTFDMVIEKLESQLRKKNTQIKDKLHVKREKHKSETTYSEQESF